MAIVGSSRHAKPEVPHTKQLLGSFVLRQDSGLPADRDQPRTLAAQAEIATDITA
jgi:hypothetical protein